MMWAQALWQQRGKFQQRATVDSGHRRNPTHKNKLARAPFSCRHCIPREKWVPLVVLAGRKLADTCLSIWSEYCAATMQVPSSSGIYGGTSAALA